MRDDSRSCIRAATYSAASSYAMRSSVVSETGLPSSGSRWVKAVTAGARSQTSSFRRPSTTMAVVARTEWTAGTAVCAWPVCADEPVAAAIISALSPDASLVFIVISRLDGADSALVFRRRPRPGRR